MKGDINTILKEGETLLWQGAPKEFETNDAEYKGKLKTSLIFWAVICVIIEACYISIAANVEQKPNLLIVLGILVFCGFFVLLNMTQARKIRKLQYALTDKNIIIKGKTTKVCPYSSIRFCDFETDKAGTVSLVCGAQTDHIGREIDPRLLTNLCLGRGVKGAALADSLAMYSLPDEAIAVLKQYLPIGARY